VVGFRDCSTGRTGSRWLCGRGHRVGWLPAAATGAAAARNAAGATRRRAARRQGPQAVLAAAAASAVRTAAWDCPAPGSSLAGHWLAAGAPGRREGPGSASWRVPGRTRICQLEHLAAVADCCSGG